MGPSFVMAWSGRVMNPLMTLGFRPSFLSALTRFCVVSVAMGRAHSFGFAR